MKPNPFRIEQFYAKYEFTTPYMLSSSDAESRSVAELLAFEPSAKAQLEQLWLGYTESNGAPYLRQTIARIYQSIAPEDVLVFSSAEEGIFVFYNALIAATDHVIVESPCYESAFEVARCTGASVSRWERRFETGWAHDLTALESLIQKNTKAIYINTPHNPTGTNMTLETLKAVLDLARERSIYVFCDEVYRELEHQPQTRLPAACDLYENAISLGSISKAYGLPGLRLGWYASRNPKLLKAARDYKDYTTICSSAPSEFLADLALRHRDILLERNLGLVQHNLPLLEAFMTRHSSLFSWVKPTASPIAFPRLEVADVAAFCETVALEAGVLLLPGAVYDQPNHLRMGYGRRNMPEALAKLEAFLER